MELHDSGDVLCQLRPIEALQLQLTRVKEFYMHIEAIKAIDENKVTDIHRKNLDDAWEGAEELAAYVFGAKLLHFINLE